MRHLVGLKFPPIQLPSILKLPHTSSIPAQAAAEPILPKPPVTSGTNKLPPTAPLPSAADIQKASEDLLQAAIRHLDSQDAYKAVRERHRIKRIDGHGVIQTRAIHKNVCRELIENPDLRAKVASFMVQANITPDEVIGFHTNHLFSALRILLINPQIVAVVHEAADHIVRGGATGTFSLTYKV